MIADSHRASNFLVPASSICAGDLPQVKLELGKWTPGSIEAVQAEFVARGLRPGERVAEWTRRLVGTRFAYESHGLRLRTDELLARLESFDCITLVYSVIALASSSSFFGYIKNLSCLRYRNFPAEPVSNRRIAGTFLDFACEALLVNSYSQMMLEDVTARVASDDAFGEVTVRRRPLRRAALNDPTESIVYPRFQGCATRTQVVWTGAGEFFRAQEVEDGDVVLLSSTLGPDGSGSIVTHAGIAMRIAGVLSLVHSSRHYVVRATAHPCEGDLWHPGVFHLCEFMGESSLRVINGVKYYGYDARHVRPLRDYARENFAAMKVLRLRS